ncbi:MAG TPA: transglutaminase-like domain-containing protein [Syntrophomonadaceae bacterium]|nr:transglutaminase-like domain-containing protein [Syntrophomonadaceae bacterium]
MLKNKLMGIILMFPLILLILPGLALSAQDIFHIDKSQIDQGIISIDYKLEGKTKGLVKISKDKVTHDYRLVPGGRYPLQEGNGEYTILVGQALTGNRYKVVAEEKVVLDVLNPDIVYLQSTQITNWNQDSKAVIKAKNLVKKANNNLEKLKLTYIIQIIKGNQDSEAVIQAQNLVKKVNNDREKLELIYNYVVNNYSYDYEKIKRVKVGYIPDIDTVYTDKKGICYDYAVITASMLRSVGIPTKIVKGYHKDYLDTYHSWNQVYIDGKWLTIDTTHDAIKVQAGHTTPMIKNTKSYITTKTY